MDLTNKTISELAQIVYSDWAKVNYGAVPYLEAMCSLTSVSDNYGLDSGESVITYFLCNAQTWKGDTARSIKAELKRRLK
jgi:hypothetical protein